MSNSCYQIANEFWNAQLDYPCYENIKKRRIYEINYILKYTDKIRTILDLGCGDGSTLLILRQLLDLSLVYGYDTSPGLIKIFNDRWGQDNACKLLTYISNIVNIDEQYQFPITDLTLSFGMLPFIFDDNDAIKIFNKINSPLFILRTTCTLKKNDEEINHFSKQLNSNYAAKYRTIDNVLKILSNKFKIKAVDRAYPDIIESKFETKQFFFVCEQK